MLELVLVLVTVVRVPLLQILPLPRLSRLPGFSNTACDRKEALMPSIHPDAEYFAFLKEGRFMLQQSASTKRTVFFPRLFEPGTGSSDLEWVPADGRGTVYATTRVRQRAPVPDYNVALIELVEGVRLTSRVDGIAPEAVQIGMPVLARIIEENGEPLLVFVPAAAKGDAAGRTARPNDRGAPL